MSVLFYAGEGAPMLTSLPEGYSMQLWHPSWRQPFAPGCPGNSFRVWTLFHALGLFRNRDYAVLTIRYGDTVVHRSCLFPGWFRFPFMDRSDLQIGDTWTHPDHRGRGLAATALRYLLSTQGQLGRTFWYLTEAENTASIRVADRSGLRWVGDGEKSRRFGLGLLGAYVLNSPTKGNNAMYPVLKRALDFSLAFVAVTLLSPVLLFVALCIKLGSQGPIFYRGTRIGRNGVPFAMLKFRTMVINADQIGASSTAEDDPRITPQGRWLRRFKLDELPQFINVLLGEMSFVGPRPQVGWAVDLYTLEERALLTVRPGITDYASLYYRNEGEILRGSLDPDKDYLEKIAPGKIRLGLEYVRTSSLLVDIKIMLATPLAIAGIDPAWCLPPMFAVTESTIRPQVVEKEVVNQ